MEYKKTMFPHLIQSVGVISVGASAQPPALRALAASPQDGSGLSALSLHLYVGDCLLSLPA